MPGKPGDLAGLADSVQKLRQVALPLARSTEFLHEDVESMSKEYRWVALSSIMFVKKNLSFGKGYAKRMWRA
jgi:hypothetical protein